MITPDPIGAEAGCGQRLRKAREAAQLTLADVATRLKMPVRVVESLEAEDWNRLGAPVFVRGQLRSYARLLGLATAPLHAASGVPPIQPTRLEPRTCTSPMQRLAEQFARRAVYVVITAALAIPVWVATRTHFAIPLQASPSLDLPTAPSAGDLLERGPDGVQVQPAPMVASMTPVPQRTLSAPALSLQFNDNSWIRVTAADGRTLEEALMRPGDKRTYAVGQVSRVVIGNAGAVEVRNHGSVQDLSTYRRANVARFTVSSDGSLQPVAE